MSPPLPEYATTPATLAHQEYTIKVLLQDGDEDGTQKVSRWSGRRLTGGFQGMGPRSVDNWPGDVIVLHTEHN